MGRGLLDSGGNLLATSYLSGIGSGGLGVLVAGNVLPVAGTVPTSARLAMEIQPSPQSLISPPV